MFDGGSVANALASRARTTDAVAIPGVAAWPMGRTRCVRDGKFGRGPSRCPWGGWVEVS